MDGLMGKRAQTEWGAKLNENTGSGMSSFGRKLMEKFGWKEGRGLGKNEDGMTEHVKVKQREESAGLGIEEHDRQKNNESWWFNSFEQALQSFRPIGNDDVEDEGEKKKKRKKKKKSKSKEKEGRVDKAEEGVNVAGGPVLPSFEDLFKATGGKRLGMRARATQKAKWERTEMVMVHQEQGIAGEGNQMKSDLLVEVNEEVVIESCGAAEGEKESPNESGKSSKKKKKKKKRMRKEVEVATEEEEEALVEEISKKEKSKKKRKRRREAQEEEESVVAEDEEKDAEEAEGKEPKQKKCKRGKKERREAVVEPVLIEEVEEEQESSKRRRERIRKKSGVK